jgi:hypothetical protein
MSGPISVDLPHRLGAAEARRRIAAKTGSLAGHLPAGADVTSAWEGDRLRLAVRALGQQVSAEVDVRETIVRVSVTLPPALAFFGKAVEAGLARNGGALLEDKSAGA